MSKEALNIASQCRATASHDLACSIVVDGGSGLLRELLIDAAMVIEALAQPEQEPVASDLHFLRQVLSVAISALYEHYKEDVRKVFTLDELRVVIDLSEPLRPQQVEDIYRRAWDVLKTAPPLPVQPEQAPVARVIDNGTPEGATEWIPFTNRVEPLKTGDLLYTTPPKRPWVGLTDDEIEDCMKMSIQKIEAALKEKNT